MALRVAGVTMADFLLAVERVPHRIGRERYLSLSDSQLNNYIIFVVGRRGQESGFQVSGRQAN